MTTTLVVMFIVGCSSPQPPPAKTVLEPLSGQLDRARGVQQTVDENAERTRKALESQERGDKP